MSSATQAPTARTSRSLTLDAPLASHEPGDATGMTLRVSTAVPGQGMNPTGPGTEDPCGCLASSNRPDRGGSHRRLGRRPPAPAHGPLVRHRGCRRTGQRRRRQPPGGTPPGRSFRQVIDPHVHNLGHEATAALTVSGSMAVITGGWLLQTQPSDAPIPGAKVVSPAPYAVPSHSRSH